MSITATISGNTLILTADRETRRDLIDAARNHGYERAEMVVSEALHERWEFIPASLVGALTDSPILAECDGLEYNEEGEVDAVGNVAWFPNYAITDPWWELARTGTVRLTVAK